ncbi:uncharacterized protein [Parasteatoda tepidariorum]|uniref:uncharacterized protein isoform X1 n=1 Tax=Parasteatoda tepidariorum TaxID=114398 RepID=UPI0039BD3C2A
MEKSTTVVDNQEQHKKIKIGKEHIKWIPGFDFDSILPVISVSFLILACFAVVQHSYMHPSNAEYGTISVLALILCGVMLITVLMCLLIPNIFLEWSVASFVNIITECFLIIAFFALGQVYATYSSTSEFELDLLPILAVLSCALFLLILVVVQMKNKMAVLEIESNQFTAEICKLTTEITHFRDEIGSFKKEVIYNEIQIKYLNAVTKALRTDLNYIDVDVYQIINEVSNHDIEIKGLKMGSRVHSKIDSNSSEQSQEKVITS